MDGTPGTWRRRLLAHLRANALVRNAASLGVSSVGTAALGAAFWVVAAHIASAHAVGRSAAQITAMVLLANLAQLSFGSMFERFLPVAGRESGRFVANAYRLCVPTAVVLALGYAALGVSDHVLPRSLVWRGVFVVSVALWTIFVLQDSALVGLREARWVPVENILYSSLKLASLPAAIVISAQWGILLAWVVPVVPAVLGVSLYLFRHRIPAEHRLGASAVDLPRNRELIRLAAVQYVTMLLWAFLPSVLSLIVIQRLGAVANARYYVTALIEGGIYSIVLAIDKSFLVELSREPDRLREHSRAAMRTLAVVVGPAVLLGVTFAPLILKIFGSGYEGASVTLLRLMLLALIGNTVLVFYSTYAWLDRKVWQMTARSAVVLGVVLGYVLLFIGSQGILSIGVAMVISSSLLTSVFLPLAIRRYRAAPRTA
jgi:O-antigen/teichoic acid export membrane protein